MSEEEQKLKIDHACKVAEEFTRLYFNTFDQRRHAMNRLYMENATVSWDGNPVTRKEAIQKFLEDLPETNHTLTALDAQPVSLDSAKDQQTVLVQAGGFIRFPRQRETKGFTRTFLITSQESKWKIATDCCRLQVPINSKSRS